MDSFQDPNETSSGSQAQNSYLFSPFLAKSLKVVGKSAFPFGSVCYNEKHNMIIACPGNNTMQFYDGTTFKPQEGKKILIMRGSVSQISYQPEHDTYLLGCAPGLLYKYHVSANELTMLKKYDRPVLGLTFLNSAFYAFLLVESKEICVGNLDDGGNVSRFDLKCRGSCSLSYLSKRNLLFLALMNGDLTIYRTNKLPHLKAIRSAHIGKWVTAIQPVQVHGKEYIVTASVDRTVRIWHLIKGRMGLLRTIHSKEIPYFLVYLEKYQMIAVAYHSNCVRFLRLPSLKLERAVYLSEEWVVHHLFLMEEKNMIGIPSRGESLIQFIRLLKE